MDAHHVAVVANAVMDNVTALVAAIFIKSRASRRRHRRGAAALLALKHTRRHRERPHRLQQLFGLGWLPLRNEFEM